MIIVFLVCVINIAIFIGIATELVSELIVKLIN